MPLLINGIPHTSDTPITSNHWGFSHGFPLGKMVSPEAPLGRGLSSGRAAADPRGVGAAAGAGARPKLQWWMDFSCFFMDFWMQCSLFYRLFDGI